MLDTTEVSILFHTVPVSFINVLDKCLPLSLMSDRHLDMPFILTIRHLDLLFLHTGRHFDFFLHTDRHLDMPFLLTVRHLDFFLHTGRHFDVFLSWSVLYLTHPFTCVPNYSFSISTQNDYCKHDNIKTCIIMLTNLAMLHKIISFFKLNL